MTQEDAVLQEVFNAARVAWRLRQRAQEVAEILKALEDVGYLADGSRGEPLEPTAAMLVDIARRRLLEHARADVPTLERLREYETLLRGMEQ